MALAVAACTVTMWAEEEALLPPEFFRLSWRIGTALTSYVFYLGKSFYPVNLAIYPHPAFGLSAAEIFSLLPFWKVGGSLLVLSGVTAAALAWRQTRPYVLVGWLWFLVMLLPVIGLVQFGIQTVADRFTYLPQIGLWIAVVWTAADVCRPWLRGRRLLGPGAAIALAILMVSTWRQTSYWRNTETVFKHTLACNARNGVAQYNLALALFNQKRLDEAIPHFQQALEVKQDHPGRQF